MANIVLSLLSIKAAKNAKPDASAYLLTAAVIFFSFAIIKPASLNLLHRIFKSIAGVLGKLISGIVLFIIFYLVITPMGIIARLSGKDFLETGKKNASPLTYWKEKKEVFAKENYHKQY